MGGGVWLVGGFRVYVNEKLKFCENSKKNIYIFFFGGGGSGSGLGGQGGCE